MASQPPVAYQTFMHSPPSTHRPSPKKGGFLLANAHPPPPPPSHPPSPPPPQKVGFLLERFYTTNSDSSYSMTRIYEGTIIVSGRSIRGEGKIEMEKYDSLFTCGFFSLITTDDGDDAFFDHLAPGHTVGAVFGGDGVHLSFVRSPRLVRPSLPHVSSLSRRWSRGWTNKNVLRGTASCCSAMP